MKLAISFFIDAQNVYWDLQINSTKYVSERSNKLDVTFYKCYCSHNWCFSYNMSQCMGEAYLLIMKLQKRNFVQSCKPIKSPF